MSDVCICASAAEIRELLVYAIVFSILILTIIVSLCLLGRQGPS